MTVRQRWRGRSPERCKFQIGDLVCLLRTQEIGIVLGQPLPPEMAKSLWLDRSDDVYLIGLLDKKGSPLGEDHDHVSQSHMKHALRVSPRIRDALLERQARYLQDIFRPIYHAVVS